MSITTGSQVGAMSLLGATKMRRLIVYSIIGLVFVLPLVILPFLPISFDWTKVMIVSVVAVLGFCGWIVTRMQEGKIEIPKSYMFLSLVGLLIVSFISAFINQKSLGLIGAGVEVNTVHMLLVFMVIMFLTSVFLRTRSAVLYAYMALMGSALVLALFHVTRLISGNSLFSSLSSTFTPIGSWTDLGIFFGLTSLLSLIALEYLDLGKRLRVVLMTLFVVSLVLVAMVNVSLVWVVLGILALIFLVYSIVANFPLSKKSDEEGGQFKLNRSSLSMLAFAVIIIAFIGVVASNAIGDITSSVFHLSFVEARPSWGATFDLFKSLSPVKYALGVGPNNFSALWALSKPTAIYNTVFWDTNFAYGVGAIPTSAITIGIIGLLAWLGFLASLLYTGFNSLFKNMNPVSRFYIVSSFLGALYLWAFQVFYVPSYTLTLLAFVFAGIFVSVMVQEKVIKEKTFNFATSSKILGLFLVMSVILILLDVAWGYVVLKKFIANIYTQKAVATLTAGDIPAGEAYIVKAGSYDLSDGLYQILVNAELAKLSQVVNAPNVTDAVRQKQFSDVANTAVAYGNNATLLNPNNFNNWFTLGTVFETLAQYKVTGAYEKAVEAYDKALALNKANPAITLVKARLEAVHGNYDGAKKLIGEALTQKNNYIDAIYLLSQIQVTQGDISSAISSIEQATLVDPSNPLLYFQLGLLEYNNKDYSAAAGAFEKAVTIQSSYANAKYFLGLSYEKLGKTADAVTLFRDLKKSNPTNKEIDLILTNLEAGKSSFTDAKPPIDDKPEKRKEPPLKEDDTTTTTKKTTKDSSLDTTSDNTATDATQ